MMAINLDEHIANIVVVDTHEHLRSEQDWLTLHPADVLADLFGHYPGHDLVSAGMEDSAVREIKWPRDWDLHRRWKAMEATWAHTRYTGYGQAVSLVARKMYDIEEITLESLEMAGPRLQAYRQPGERLRLLRDVARLDHVQIDAAKLSCPPDASGPEFFLYDLTWECFASGRIDPAVLHAQTRVEVRDLASLDDAMATLMRQQGPTAIAIKTQHAYARTLMWEPRTAAQAQVALTAILRDGDHAEVAHKLCLGDYCLGRGAALAAELNLPIKIHTGYYAGNHRMPLDGTRPAHLWNLLHHYPQTRFVLMHTGYPYREELIAMVKHYRNAYADLCWAWSIDPPATQQFVRQYLNVAPVNKLLAFGGDTFFPTHVIAYAQQARDGLARALKAQVRKDHFTRRQAAHIATRVLRENALEIFDVPGCRSRINSAMASQVAE